MGVSSSSSSFSRRCSIAGRSEKQDEDSSCRLSEEESVQILRIFEFIHNNHQHKQKRPSQTKIVTKTTMTTVKKHFPLRLGSHKSSSIPLNVFLEYFPVIIRPYFAAVLPEWRKRRGTMKSGGTISVDNLISVCSICFYPKPSELETFLLCGFENLQKLQKFAFSSELLTVSHLLTFGYILSLYTRYPQSALFCCGSKATTSDRNDKSSESTIADLATETVVAGSATETAVAGPATETAVAGPATEPMDASRLVFLYEQRNSWDDAVLALDFSSSTAAAAAVGGIVQNDSDGSRVQFPSLEASFLRFRQNHKQDDFLLVASDWISEYLKFLPQTLSCGLRELILKKKTNRQAQINGDGDGDEDNYNDDNNEFDSIRTGTGTTTTPGTGSEPFGNDSRLDGSLHRFNSSRNRSMIEQQQNNSSKGGWKGFFLCSASKCIDDEFCFAIHQCNPSFHTHRWTRLYASWFNGRSFNLLAKQIIHYEAPSVVVIKAVDGGNVVGACVGSTWKESNGKFYGDADSFLWSFKPIFNIFKASGVGNNFVYFNSKNSFYPKGVGFGGTSSCFRLWIDSDLTECYSCLSDKTYKSGHIAVNAAANVDGSAADADADAAVDADVFQTSIRVDEIEVWGTGGVEAVRIQAQSQGRDENIRQERRQVDRGKLLENEFDRKYLLGDGERNGMMMNA